MKDNWSKIILGVLIGYLLSIIWGSMGEKMGGEVYIYTWEKALEMTFVYFGVLFMGWHLREETKS